VAAGSVRGCCEISAGSWQDVCGLAAGRLPVFGGFLSTPRGSFSSGSFGRKSAFPLTAAAMRAVKMVRVGPTTDIRFDLH
jgi:hypothetical protein